MKLSEYVSQVINDPKYGGDVEWVRLNLHREHLERIEAARDAEVRERALREAEEAAADALNTWWLTDTAPDDDSSSVMDVRKAVRALRAGVVSEEPEWESAPTGAWVRMPVKQEGTTE